MSRNIVENQAPPRRKAPQTQVAAAAPAVVAAPPPRKAAPLVAQAQAEPEMPELGGLDEFETVAPVPVVAQSTPTAPPRRRVAQPSPSAVAHTTQNTSPALEEDEENDGFDYQAPSFSIEDNSDENTDYEEEVANGGPIAPAVASRIERGAGLKEYLARKEQEAQVQQRLEQQAQESHKRVEEIHRADRTTEPIFLYGPVGRPNEQEMAFFETIENAAQIIEDTNTMLYDDMTINQRRLRVYAIFRLAQECLAMMGTVDVPEWIREDPTGQGEDEPLELSDFDDGTHAIVAANTCQDCFHPHETGPCQELVKLKEPEKGMDASYGPCGCPVHRHVGEPVIPGNGPKKVTQPLPLPPLPSEQPAPVAQAAAPTPVIAPPSFASPVKPAERAPYMQGRPAHAPQVERMAAQMAQERAAAPQAPPSGVSTGPVEPIRPQVESRGIKETPPAGSSMTVAHDDFSDQQQRGVRQLVLADFYPREWFHEGVTRFDQQGMDLQREMLGKIQNYWATQTVIKGTQTPRPDVNSWSKSYRVTLAAAIVGQSIDAYVQAPSEDAKNVVKSAAVNYLMAHKAPQGSQVIHGDPTWEEYVKMCQAAGKPLGTQIDALAF